MIGSYRINKISMITDPEALREEWEFHTVFAETETVQHPYEKRRLMNQREKAELINTVVRRLISNENTPRDVFASILAHSVYKGVEASGRGKGKSISYSVALLEPLVFPYVAEQFGLDNPDDIPRSWLIELLRSIS